MTTRERLETAQQSAASLFNEIASDHTVVNAIYELDPGLAASVREAKREWDAATEAFLGAPS